ncbi:MAG TPA: hypothetical protein VOB72_27395 [Candidatus Dormibacteraeota bacterium]|nr:hypothetical protein [Candidatus Dormibacteraeota bacterium]
MAWTTTSSLDRGDGSRSRPAWRSVCSGRGWWLIWIGLAAVLAIDDASPGALAALGVGPAGLVHRLAHDWPADLAQLSALAVAAGATGRALDVRPRLLLPAGATLLLVTLLVMPGPEVPLSALLVGLFLAEASPPRDLNVDRAVEAGTVVLALACPALLAAGAGPLAPLHAAAVGAGISVTAWLVATAVVRLDRQVGASRTTILS